MREANQFENWTNQIMEGTWALPETAEDMARLQELMSKPLPCGPDGEYASEQLYDLIGDDSLFDDIGELADKDPDADCRELVKARAQELGVEIDVKVSESPTQEEPASGYEAGQANAAAGKERSMGMNLGGEKAAMKQTAGGQDIEEGYGDTIIFKGKEIDQDTIEYDMQDFDDLIFVLEDGIKYTDGTPVAEEDYDALHEEYDLAEWVRIDYMDRVAPQYEGMDSFVNPNDQDGTDNEKAVDPMADDDLADEDLDENREMEELLRLAGQQNEVEETQDVDTGKQALKAERDPMLERMLNIVNR